MHETHERDPSSNSPLQRRHGQNEDHSSVAASTCISGSGNEITSVGRRFLSRRPALNGIVEEAEMPCMRAAARV